MWTVLAVMNKSGTLPTFLFSIEQQRQSLKVSEEVKTCLSGLNVIMSSNNIIINKRLLMETVLNLLFHTVSAYM